MAIFNVYRRGFELGYAHGREGSRRRADWELRFTAPVTWAPLVDVRSYLAGYQAGFEAGAAAQKLLVEVIGN